MLQTTLGSIGKPYLKKPNQSIHSVSRGRHLSPTSASLLTGLLPPPILHTEAGYRPLSVTLVSCTRLFGLLLVR